MLKDNLKSLRRSTGMTQKLLAERMDVSLKTVSHWESGYTEPSLSMLTRLRNILSVEYEDLLD